MFVGFRSRKGNLLALNWPDMLNRMQSEPMQIQDDRLELARRAFRQFRARCFWSYRPDLVITEAEIPFIVRELRRNGGHEGYRVAAQICP